MTSLKEVKKDLTEMKITLARIEEHIKNQNGKVDAHESFLRERCPVLHQTLREMVIKNTVFIGIGIAILNLAAWFLIHRYV